MIELRPEVLAFAVKMEEQMRKNDAEKGDSWKVMMNTTLSVMALNKALLMSSAANVADSEPHAVKHAIDIANYCMMITANYGALDNQE